MKHLKTLPVKGSDTAELFGTEKIGKILFKIAPPVMLAQLILALYNVVDSYFVGQLSDPVMHHRTCGRQHRRVFGGLLYQSPPSVGQHEASDNCTGGRCAYQHCA